MSAATTHREEMESESGLIWHVRWLHFNDGASHEQVNAELARVAAGWEPFATIQNPTGGWALLVKKHA